MNPSPVLDQLQLSDLLSQAISSGIHPEACLAQYLSSVSCVQGLLAEMTQNQVSAVRQLAAILLKRGVINHWNQLSAEMQASLKIALIDRVRSEPEPLVRNNIVSLAVCVHSYVEPVWEEMLHFIATSLNSPDKEIGLCMLSGLLEDSETLEFFMSLEDPFFEAVSQSLEGQSTRRAQLYALKALRQYASNFDEKSISQGLTILIPRLMAILDEAYRESDEGI